MAEIELWSVELKGGSEHAVLPPTNIRLTNVSFGEELADPNGRSVIKLAYKALKPDDDDDEDEDEEDDDDENGTPDTTTILTALTAGKIEQSTLNIVLLEDKPYILTNTGKNTVYITGNYIEVSDEPPYDDEDDFDEDEDAYDLDEVSSDVEMHPDDLESDADRFEEVVDEPKEETKEETKSAKRPRDSDAEKPKEKKNKKQKAEDGKPVAVSEEPKKNVEKKKEEKKKEGAPEKQKSKVKELPGGLKIEDTKIGDGPEAKKGSRVGMRYVGKLLNGNIFDKNVKGKPFYFKIGKGEVIKGWDEGIPGMKVGGERILTVPAAMAYGNKKIDGIPPNSVLRFEVKLLEVKP